jgi:hypothetical protein
MSVTERLQAFRSSNRARPWRASLARTIFGSKGRKVVLMTATPLIVLVVLSVFAAFFVDEPLRQRMEANLNRSLTGYTVHIGKLDFHPIGLSLDLENSVIFQSDNPEPPVAQIANLRAGIQWGALLRGRLVADFQIADPKLYINRKQAKKELDDKIPMKERGWQRALEEIYPLKINRFVIRNGSLTYVDEGPFRPLELTGINLLAENIRNVRSDADVYPSPVQIEALVFGKGKLRAEGHADLLAEPHATFKSETFALEDVDLAYFKPIVERYNFTVRQGRLSAYGQIEYGATTERVDIAELRVQDADAEYIHKLAESVATTAGKEVDSAAKKYSDAPSLVVNIDKFRAQGRLGFLNAASQPQYRLFWDELDLQIANFSNQSSKGVMTGSAQGRFMGSGATQIAFTARPITKGPDFDLKVAIDSTDMKLMNNLWRSYGNFDVAGGLFSFYSELSVRNGSVEGYVKPLFYEMDVYDQRQDKDKGIFRKLYEGIIGGLSWILQNAPRDEVATAVNVSGKLSNPQTSTLEAILGIIQNAFFKAILPGFERQARPQEKSTDRKQGRRRPGKSLRSAWVNTRRRTFRHA